MIKVHWLGGPQDGLITSIPDNKAPEELTVDRMPTADNPNPSKVVYQRATPIGTDGWNYLHEDVLQWKT